MPIYAYQCCGKTAEAFNRVDNRRTNAPKCPECGQPMDIELRAPQVSVQRECHYHCPVTGKEVSSHRTRRNIMAEHGLIDANDFPPAKVAEKGEKAKAKREEIASGLGKPIYLQ